jgi:hypothetical protein
MKQSARWRQRIQVFFAYFFFQEKIGQEKAG